MAWKKQRPKTIRLQLIPRPNAYTQTIDVMGVGLVTAGSQVHANEKEVEGANEGVEGKGIPLPHIVACHTSTMFDCFMHVELQT